MSDRMSRSAVALIRWYQRHLSRYTRPCRAGLAGGPSCSQRMTDAVIRQGLLGALLVAAPQVWLCCGKKPQSGGANSHGTSRYGCMEPSHHRNRR
jgi:putative component of membrane protein insertase Oxa1/YidC/SpoIIIJ protein YidD